MDKALNFDLKSRYLSDLEEMLNRDSARIDRYQLGLNSKPIMIPVKVDLQMVRSGIAEAKQIIQSELAAMSQGPSILNAAGAPARAAAQQAAASAGLISTATRTVYEKNSQKIKSIIQQQTEQLGEGLKRISKYKINPASGIAEKNSLLSTVDQQDSANLSKYNSQMRELIALQQQYATAKSSGDLKSQRSSLSEMKNRLDEFNIEAARNGLTGTNQYKRGERKVESLQEKLAMLDGKELTASQRKAKTDATRAFEREDTGQYRKTQSELTANETAMTQAKLLTDQIARETEINRLLTERRQILKSNQEFFQQQDAKMTQVGNTNLADRAFRRTLDASHDVDKHDLDTAKSNVSSLLNARKQQEKQDEQAAKEQSKIARQQAEHSLKQRIQDEQKSTHQRLSQIKVSEIDALAGVTKKKERASISGQANQDRQSTLHSAAKRLGGMEVEASAGGYDALSLKARAARNDMERKAIDLHAKHEAAAHRSGQANDFHTSSILRNALSFAKWQAAMQLTMLPMQALLSGLSAVSKVDREFATLQAVFRGTADEAQNLKVGILTLAAAEGRSSDEAMDAAIRFSRLGLTRVEVLQATTVALMAANIAEITAAEAAEKYTAIMATYKLTVGDLPEILNRMNTISNIYNVTNKDLLDGVTRVSGVAHELGMELSDLEGIIGATTAATGRSGAETGNALKTIIQKIADPATIEKLKTLFNFDVTDGTGNLKDMTAVLTDMSKIFPTLTNLQRAQFTELVAGTRQGDKFTKVMSQMSTAQYLTAAAAADSNGALDENAKILDSLQSKVQALNTAWEGLWVTIGDTGSLDFVKDLIEDLKIVIGYINQVDKGKDKTKAIKPNNIPDRLVTAEAANVGYSTRLSPPKSFSPGEIRGAIANLKSIQTIEKNARGTDKESKSAVTNAMKDLITRGGVDYAHVHNTIQEAANDSGTFTLPGGLRFSVGNSNKDVVRYLQSSIERMQGYLDDDDKSSNRSDTNKSRARYKVLTTGQKGLSDLAERLNRPDYDKNQALKDFDQFSHLMPSIPGGALESAQNYAGIRERIISGKDAGTDVARWAKMFGDAAPGAQQDFLSKQKITAIALRKELGEVNKKMVDISTNIASKQAAGKPISDEQTKDLAKYTDQIQELNDKLQETERALENVKEAASINALELNKSIDRTLRQAGNSITSLKHEISSHGEQPLDRQIMLDQREINDPQQRLEQGITASDDALKLNPKDLGERDRNAILKYRQRELGKINTLKRQELDDGMEGRQIEDSMKRGSISAEISAKGSLIGRNSSEQGINQSRFLMDRMQQSESGLQGASSPADPLQKANELGKLLRDEQTVRSNLLSLEERQFSIGAERKNLELQLTESAKKQTEEASKRLLMAGRDDQLRAAALKRTIRNSGSINENEFQFLSSNTRQALTQYLPNESPDALNPAKEQYREGSRLLDQETSQIAGTIGELRKNFESLSSTLTRLFDPTSNANPVNPTTTSTPQPNISLNVQAVNVSVSVANEMQNIVEQVVKNQFTTMSEQLKSWVRSTMPNPMTGVNGATGN